jgi:hypothetical protein
VESDLTAQIHELISIFQQAQNKATEMLQAARTQGISFGLDYNHVDGDIAQLVGRLRYMELIAQRRQSTQRDDS